MTPDAPPSRLSPSEPPSTTRSTWEDTCPVESDSPSTPPPRTPTTSSRTTSTTAAYTDNILEDYVYYAIDQIKSRYGGFCKLDPADLDGVMKLGDDINAYALEMYERYPAVMETHFGGSQRATVAAAATGIAGAMATGVADCGLNCWYLSMLQHKERTGRLGFYGFDLQDQCGSANSFAYRSDEGLPMEVRGPNYPNYAMNVGHLSGYTGIPKAAHVARTRSSGLRSLTPPWSSTSPT